MRLYHCCNISKQEPKFSFKPPAYIRYTTHTHSTLSHSSHNATTHRNTQHTQSLLYRTHASPQNTHSIHYLQGKKTEEISTKLSIPVAFTLPPSHPIPSLSCPLCFFTVLTHPRLTHLPQPSYHTQTLRHYIGTHIHTVCTQLAEKDKGRVNLRN